MKILFEDTMPYGEAFFAPLGDCQSYSHQTITPSDLFDTDYLLVRSTTKVNEALLSEARQLSFVSTATAGTNHMDKQWLNSAGIDFSSAAGCNAVAVAEYVLSAMVTMARKKQKNFLDWSVGIVGAGHVGTVLSGKLQALGIEVKLSDPPLQDAGDPRSFSSLDDVFDCDVITLHVPFEKEGPYATLHMVDRARMLALRPGQLLINACRGEVLDNKAALQLFEQGHQMQLVLDVWENEPEILQALVPHIELCTAHIAGHTIEGKARGTEMLYQQVCEREGIVATMTLEDVLPASEFVPQHHDITQIDEQLIGNLILSVYDIQQDSDFFRKTIAKPGQFAYIRKHYAIRREFAALQVSAGNSSVSEALYRLGFSRPI